MEVLLQRDGAAECPHPRHPILYMPGFKIRMPIKLFACVSLLVIDSRLVDVDLAPQNLLHYCNESGMPGEPLKYLIVAMHSKNRANFLTGWLRNDFLARRTPIIPPELFQFISPFLHFLRGKNPRRLRYPFCS